LGSYTANRQRYHLNNYRPNDPAYIKQTAHYKHYLDQYCSLAFELKICIVPGTLVERHPWKPDPEQPNAIILNDKNGDYQLLNVSYFISDDGVILGSYSKRNLWDQERLHLSPGHEKHRSISTPFGKVGLLSCWDLAFPEAFRELVHDGAEIIIGKPTFVLQLLILCREPGSCFGNQNSRTNGSRDSSRARDSHQFASSLRTDSFGSDNMLDTRRIVSVWTEAEPEL
jgi:hypothetical protein